MSDRISTGQPDRPTDAIIAKSVELRAQLNAASTRLAGVVADIEQAVRERKA